MSNVEMFPQYDTKLMTDVWSQASEFLTDYQNAGIPTTISNQNATTLYYLLYAKYGNTPIANYDENQWKYKMFSIIFQYGPTWEKRLDIQSKLRGMNETDILTGSKQINDHAYNPSTEPSGPNVVNGEITSVNEQSKIKYTKSKVDAYASLYAMLETDVTEDFLGRFKRLFLTIVEPEYPLWYITDVEEE